MILAGDVGGTKSRLALFSGVHSDLNWRVEETFATADVTSPVDLFADFANRHDAAIGAVVLAIAGPILDGRVDGANLPWVIDAAEVARALGGVPVRMYNDLEASGYGLDVIQPDQFVTLNEGSPRDGHRRALVSPGTGFGQAVLVPTGSGLLCLASEAAHADYSPRTDEEWALSCFLRARYGRATVEHVVSGPGLENVYRFVCDSGLSAGPNDPELDEPDLPPAVAGASTGDGAPRATHAMRLWVKAFGAEVGNVALRTMAHSGVFLGGGIPPKILPALQTGDFLEACFAKDPWHDLVAAMPIRVVMNADTPLLGAARVGRELLALLKA